MWNQRDKVSEIIKEINEFIIIRLAQCPTKQQKLYCILSYSTWKLPQKYSKKLINKRL